MLDEDAEACTDRSADDVPHLPSSVALEHGRKQPTASLQHLLSMQPVNTVMFGEEGETRRV